MHQNKFFASASPPSPMHIKGTKELGRRSPGSFVIQLSTINIECGTHKAQSSEIKRGFPTQHLFHKHEDGNHVRISKPAWCDICGRIVGASEIIKGYEIAKDQYVYMTEEELDAMKEGFETKTFQMLGVTKLDHKLRPEEVLDTYIVVPVAQKRKKDDEMNAKLYSLLADKLTSDGYVLIGKMFTVRGGELFGAITGEMIDGKSMLYMYSLYYPEELKDPTTLGLSTPAISAKERELMGKLIEKEIKLVDYSVVTSQLKEIFEKVISAKVSGVMPSSVAPAPVGPAEVSAESALEKALSVAAYESPKEFWKFCNNCGKAVKVDAMGNCPDCGTWLGEEDEEEPSAKKFFTLERNIMLIAIATAVLIAGGIWVSNEKLK